MKPRHVPNRGRSFLISGCPPVLMAASGSCPLIATPITTLAATKQPPHSPGLSVRAAPSAAAVSATPTRGETIPPARLGRLATAPEADNIYFYMDNGDQPVGFELFER